MTRPIVTLDIPEFMYVAQGGFYRRTWAMIHGRSREEGPSDFGFDRDIMGQLAEYGYAKLTGQFWSPHLGHLDTNTGDVGGLQIKSVLDARLSLIIREHDPANFNYILAIIDTSEIAFGALGRVSITFAGWIEGLIAKNKKKADGTLAYWREKDKSKNIHQAAFFVPQCDLHPMDTLRFELSARRA